MQLVGSAMSAKLFEVIKLLESKRISFQIARSTPFGLEIRAMLVGKRVEIAVDEDDSVDVAIFRGDESVEVGMDAVARALSDDE